MALTDSQLAALRNLARKQAGETVDWISIADARALTELGLAERNREGWKITSAGQEAFKAQQAGDAARGVTDEPEERPITRLS